MYLGVDLGGTNIAIGVVTDAGQILTKDSVPTIRTRPYPEIVADMAKLCEKVTADAGLTLDDIQAIGIGSPGSIDNKNGIVEYANNLQFHHAAIAEELRKHIDKPINLENDANAAAYGEYRINGEGASSFIFITLGTGVGGGIIIDGKIYRGFNGAGGELGHLTLVHKGEPCTCGNLGCWESYASVTALIRQTREAIIAHPESAMNELIAGDLDKVSGRTSFNAARQGDVTAQKVVNQYIEYVASGLLGVVNVFQPEIVAIGGGISREGDFLLKPIQEYVEKYGYNKYMPRTTIKTATLFGDAGIIGAALAAQ